MIKDLILSFKDNISQKAKNPFLGIYVIVWTIRNWELVYSVFNFDDDVKRETKIAFIKNYFVENPFLANIFWNIVISTGVLIGTYLLLNLSRLIVNFYDKIVSPWIYQITDKSSIVLKSDFQVLEHKNESLEKKIIELKKEKNQLQDQIENIEIIKNQNAKESIEKDFEFINLEKIYKKLEKPDLLTLTEVDMAQKKKIVLKESSKFDILLELDLVSIISYEEDNFVDYELTKEGKALLSYHKLQN